MKCTFDGDLDESSLVNDDLRPWKLPVDCDDFPFRLSVDEKQILKLLEGIFHIPIFVENLFDASVDSVLNYVEVAFGRIPLNR